MLCVRLGRQTHDGSCEECFSPGCSALRGPSHLLHWVAVLWYSLRNHSLQGCGLPGTSLLKWRRKWQPTPVFLSAEFHGQRSLSGYSLKSRLCSPWDCKELDTTERLLRTHVLFISVGSILRKTNKHKNTGCTNCELSLFTVCGGLQSGRQPLRALWRGKGGEVSLCVILAKGLRVIKHTSQKLAAICEEQIS